jgi:peptide/nickel transport system substrate-binding protein
VTIDQLPGASMADGMNNHTFQAYLVDNWAGVMTPGYELGFATSSNGGYNLADWKDPNFYAALATANAYPDPLSTAGGTLYNAAERIYVNQAPIIFVAQIQPSVGMSSKLNGYAWTTVYLADYNELSFSTS